MNTEFEELDDGDVRMFCTGATRDTAQDKLDFEGFLSPLVIERYAEYMHMHRVQSDGTLRDSDNWQRGIPISAYMKSMWRHFFAVWKGYRVKQDVRDDLCALLFNVMGMLHELLKVDDCLRQHAAEIVAYSKQRNEEVCA